LTAQLASQGKGRSSADHEYYISKRTLNIILGREQVNPLPTAMARFVLGQWGPGPSSDAGGPRWCAPGL